MQKYFFVYMLKDPDTNIPFYVGKGCGYRDKSHLKPSLWESPEKTTNPFLYYKIRSLMKWGKTPIIERIHERLTELEAYEIEESYICQYGTRFSGSKDGILFNLSPGKGRYSGYNILWSEERRKTHQEFFKQRRIYDPSYEELYEDYVTNNKTRKSIAEENECSVMLVKKRLQELGVYKPPGAQYPKKKLNECVSCGKGFYTAAKTIRKTCSAECYSKHRRKS